MARGLGLFIGMEPINLVVVLEGKLGSGTEEMRWETGGMGARSLEKPLAEEVKPKGPLVLHPLLPRSCSSSSTPAPSSEQEHINQGPLSGKSKGRT